MDGRLDPPAPETGAEAASATAARRGVLYGFSAYLIWGTMPLYFRLLAPSGAWEILAHRILWSLVLCVLVLLVLRRPFPTWRRPLRQHLGMVLAGILIAINWVVYLVAVTTDRVTEAALGYFLNPIVSVALGLLLLGERLRRLQFVALVIGASGGLFLAATGGTVPWIAFALAFSFGFYGLVKKKMGVGLGALQGLTAETAVLAPAALGVIVWLSMTGGETAFSQGPVHFALLASSGVFTAIPLLLFAMAANRIPLVTLGLLQFIAPVLQFITGLLLGEHMTPARWIGFAIVWVALAVLMADSVRARRAVPPRSRL
ncbi:EamA family transporter RarD [Mobilicoccus caccae]|uniref:Protein RarD n=1 Tax=Mobilicoccus caccae TaxID=1859295 RepID=A0ABQ6IRT2_9MICO|nr:EamA family transporter RarD [Mobilicoccus caccae]GMA40617.1 protein RarD [Mobilicoccus caccae]